MRCNNKQIFYHLASKVYIVDTSQMFCQMVIAKLYACAICIALVTGVLPQFTADYTCVEHGPCHSKADCTLDGESSLWKCLCRDGFEGNGTHCDGMLYFDFAVGQLLALRVSDLTIRRIEFVHGVMYEAFLIRKGFIESSESFIC